MKYPDFVAKTGQVNTPPGSYDTIKTWIHHGFIRKDSSVLEIGCSTGFVSYQIHSYIGAKVRGIDISEISIKKAKKNCSGIDEIVFSQNDARNLPFKDNNFSHVIIGGHLGFVSRNVRSDHVKEAVRVLSHNGFLLSSIYYFINRPSDYFVNKLNKEFDLKLYTDDNYEYWNELFKLENLACEYEKHYKITAPTESRKKQYLSRFKNSHREKWKQKVELFAENAKYIQFFVKILRKVDPNDPYIQLPRGGIYTWKDIEEKL